MQTAEAPKFPCRDISTLERSEETPKSKEPSAADSEAASLLIKRF